MDAEFWKIIVDKNLAGIYIHDENFKIIYVNDIVTKATKYNKEELYSLPSVFELAHPEDREWVKELHKDLFKGKTLSYETRYLTKDGRVRWAWGFVFPLRYKGKLYGVGCWIDVTRVKRYERELETAAELHRILIEESLTPVYIIQDGKFVYVNKAFEEISGYRRDELSNIDPFSLVHPEDRDFVYKRFLERLKGSRKPETYSFRILTRKGEVRWIVVRPGRIVYRGKPAIAATSHDITEIYRMKEELEKKNECLLLLNRILRHDIANALTFVRFALEEGDESLSKKAIERIDYIIDLIKSLREFEKAIGELKPIRVDEIVKDVAKGYDVDLKLEEATALANEGLKIVLNNLIQNAVIHGGGKVEVEVSKRDGFCVIKVKDWGKGIPDEIKDKIFEEGFTTNRGSGLGLYIVKKLVEIYGGEIRVYDNVPNGTVFEVILKLPTEESSSSSSKPS